MGWTQITAPDGLPVELADLKRDLRIDGTDSDERLIGLLETAVGYLDGPNGRLGRCLVQQTWDWTFDQFPLRSPEAVRIPLEPVISVTSVTYVDGNGDAATWSSALWQLAGAGGRGRLAPAYGQSWPSARRQLDAITVRLVLGHARSTGQVPGHNVPVALKRALTWLVAHWNENGEPTVQGNAIELPAHLGRIFDAFPGLRFG
ncbi:MAG: hypothetical protein AB7F67_03890 [Rhodospirillaceae bacterium]